MEYNTLEQAYSAVCKERDELKRKYLRAIDGLVKCAHDNRWIPVEERMPKSGTYCAVFVTDSEFKCKYYHIDRMESNDFFVNGADSGYKVTHWMPLPEPPKED